MSFEESTLTLGGETRKIQSLEFFKLGVVGATNGKGVTTVKCGAYNFFVAKEGLTFRHKVEGARTYSPVKKVNSFAELDKLSISNGATKVIAEPIVSEADTKDPIKKENSSPNDIGSTQQKNNSVKDTKEETIMAKLNTGTKQIEIPANVVGILKKLGITGDVIEVTQFDDAIGKAKGKDLADLTKFDDEVNKQVQPPEGNTGDTKPETPDGSVGANTGDEKPDENAGDETPDANTGDEKPEDKDGNPDGDGSDDLQGSDLFGGDGAQKGDQKPARPEKTEAERAVEREARKAKLLKEDQLMKENAGRIEDLRLKSQNVAGATDAFEALRKLILIENKIPLFRTLVPSDTRLRASVNNRVKPAARTYHPSLRGNPLYKKTGKNIEAKYAANEFELVLRESNPSQPTGFFIYVPECLLGFTPSKLAQHSEREMVMKAVDSPNQERVIKLFTKAEMILLETILDAEIQEYNITSGVYDKMAPRIYLFSKTDPNTGVAVFSLRARDHANLTTKLSIRSFIPMSTHDVIRMGDKSFSKELTTDALFKRLLTYVPDGTPANKFSQLVQESKALFVQDNEGNIVYDNFKNTENVIAYDSTTSSPKNIPMPLPKVIMSTPTTATAVARPVFSKSKYTEAGYNMAYKAAKDAVGDQITKQKRQTNKSILTSHTEEIARMTALTNLLEGSQIQIK